MTSIEIVKQIAKNGCKGMSCENCPVYSICGEYGMSRKESAEIWLLIHKHQKTQLLSFENVSSNIICSRITGEKQLLELTLPVTAENEKQCLEAYIKTGKLKVIIEVTEC